MPSRKLFVANWKMNPVSHDEARKLFLASRKVSDKFTKVEVVLCPPAVFLGRLGDLARKSKRLSLGAQDVFWESEGSFTGELSPIMFQDLGARYAIVGHSERRALGETDEVVNRKILACLRAGLQTILCVGEKIRDSEAEYLGFVRGQLQVALNKVLRTDLPSLVIAYEPVWAIGKNSSGAITSRDLHVMSIFLRKTLSEIYDRASAEQVRLLYGGSVSPENVAALVSEGEVDGLLVGRESRKPESLPAIFEALS